MSVLVNSVPHVLRDGMKEAGLTQQELFDRYRLRGGKAKQPNTLGEWLRGKRDIPYVQLTILFGVVNDELMSLGKDQIEIPFPKGLVETASQPTLTAIEGGPHRPRKSASEQRAGNRYFGQTAFHQERRDSRRPTSAVA